MERTDGSNRCRRQLRAVHPRASRRRCGRSDLHTRSKLDDRRYLPGGTTLTRTWCLHARFANWPHARLLHRRQDRRGIRQLACTVLPRGDSRCPAGSRALPHGRSGSWWFRKSGGPRSRCFTGTDHPPDPSSARNSHASLAHPCRADVQLRRLRSEFVCRPTAHAPVPPEADCGGIGHGHHRRNHGA